MEDGVKYCPLTKLECLESKCGWYVNGLNECSMNTLAQAVDSLADTLFEESLNDN